MGFSHVLVGGIIDPCLVKDLWLDKGSVEGSVSLMMTIHFNVNINGRLFGSDE